MGILRVNNTRVDEMTRWGFPDACLEFALFLTPLGHSSPKLSKGDATPSCDCY